MIVTRLCGTIRLSSNSFHKVFYCYVVSYVTLGLGLGFLGWGLRKGSGSGFGGGSGKGGLRREFVMGTDDMVDTFVVV